MYSIVFQLNVLEHPIIQPTTGRFVNALFYNLLNDIYPSMAEELHDLSAEKPFTLSPLHAKFEHLEHSRLLKIDVNYPVWFRVTILDDKIFFKLVHHIKQRKIKEVFLDKTIFNVANIYLTKDQHTLANFTTFEDLWNNHTYFKSFTFDFMTPTSFSKNDFDYPLPEPSLVFKSLFKKWNAFSSFPIPDVMFKKLINHITVSRFDIRTQSLLFHKYKKIGFVGNVTFFTNFKKFDYLSLFNMLSFFAFYSGVGRKTTMGMGQIKIMEYN